MSLMVIIIMTKLKFGLTVQFKATLTYFIILFKN